MVKLFEEQNVKIGKLAKDTGINRHKLYRYASGRTAIEKMPTKLVLELAFYFKIEVNELMNKMIEYQKNHKLS